MKLHISKDTIVVPLERRFQQPLSLVFFVIEIEQRSQRVFRRRDTIHTITFEIKRCIVTLAARKLPANSLHQTRWLDLTESLGRVSESV